MVTGTVISSTAFNALTADLGTGLSTAITKDGQTTATSKIPFALGISINGATSGVTSLLATDAVTATITLPSATGTLVTGTSGRYTPTLTNGTNVAASTAYPLSYIRVGNIVFVGGFISIDTTATGSSSLRMSLPIASNFTSSTDAGGSGSRPVNGGANDGWNMYATAATDDMTIDGWSMDTAAQNMFFTFSYQVL